MSERARQLASPLAIGGIAAAATLALRLRDPHVPGAWGLCPTKALTDLDCPLCGSLRAVNDLTHLDVGAALSSNLVLVLAVPLIVFLWGRRLVACWRGGEAMRPLTAPAWVWGAGLVALGVFTVVRNLPGSWLAA
ncbi:MULTISPECIES: DUF2752 domain-containing protein [Nocardioides]|uniref:DUF2752 domain-containing protein n=1 Tax=Nocardioides TaxID=1839 RepID=UPI00032FC3FC|nr:MULTISPECIES: DUF2752 domain-containing protein [Nocardioides]EON23547.1 hypothetical protein CF8_2497 [Nocardioides sp. CF8]